MTAQIPTTMRELHSRQNDGIHVRLLWSARDGRLAVTVTDTKNGEAFCLDVREGERALEVFNHPYAFAAWHGIETGSPAETIEPDFSIAA
jgi:hypothetical protein